MPISNPTPTEVAAVPAKTFPHLWIKDLFIRAHTTSAGAVKIELAPYNANTGEIGPGLSVVSTEELFLAVQQVPEVAAAYAAVLASVEPLRAWVEARAAETP